MHRDPPAFEVAYRRYGFWIILLGALILAGVIVQPFVPALCWAGVLSVLMFPIYQRFRKKFAETPASIFTVLATIVFVMVPLAIAGLLLYVQASDTISALTVNSSHSANPLGDALDQLAKSIEPTLRSVGFQGDLSAIVAENQSDWAKQAAKPLGNLAVKFGTGIFTAVVALFVMFYMVRDGHKLKAPFLSLMPLPPESTGRILTRCAVTIRSVFMAIVVVSFVQATIGFIAYWIAGVPSPAVFAFVTFIACLVPLLGGPVVYVPVSLMLLAQGKIWQGILVLAVGFAVISQVDNLLRPYYIGNSTNFHVVAVFVSLLGGVLALGPVGLMVGPVFLAICLGLLDVIQELRGKATVTPGEGGAPT
ncbi:MAG: AI-2E family transporter [Armatimonadetes bacterium]|nr:AI-2E family transporter [Armatimonadota bacterium]